MNTYYILRTSSMIYYAADDHPHKFTPSVDHARRYGSVEEAGYALTMIMCTLAPHLHVVEVKTTTTYNEVNTPAAKRYILRILGMEDVYFVNFNESTGETDGLSLTKDISQAAVYFEGHQRGIDDTRILRGMGVAITTERV